MITVDGQLERAITFLGAIPKAAEQASARALNAAAREGRESAIAAITSRYAVRAADVRDKITLTTATPDRLSVSIVARSGPLSLTYFPHTPTVWGTGGRGMPALRAEVLRGQARDVPGAFIAPINGKPRIMMRVGGRTSTGNDKIKSVPALPIAKMLGAPSVEREVQRRALAVLEDRMNREIDRALGKAE